MISDLETNIIADMRAARICQWLYCLPTMHAYTVCLLFAWFFSLPFFLLYTNHLKLHSQSESVLSLTDIELVSLLKNPLISDVKSHKWTISRRHSNPIWLPKRPVDCWADVQRPWKNWIQHKAFGPYTRIPLPLKNKNIKSASLIRAFPLCIILTGKSFPASSTYQPK